MSANAIARRYAKALVQIAAEESAVEKFHEELARVEAMFADCPELGSLLSNPGYGIEAKLETLREVAGKLQLSETIRNFLLLLQERNRVACLGQIIACYSVLADELSGVLRPVVTTALPLADSRVAEIKTALEKSTGKKIVLQVEVEPSLIGGVVTRIGDKVLDGSVKTQLTRIEDILQKG
ncbi:MAG TPA: ATP synthase F1 subunit delta [Geobacteraceae bacterium]|nr:ATP synthase F1 subunit delta [Geobacteraceae bacterium]